MQKAEDIRQLLKSGKTVKHITEALNCSAGTVVFHRKKLGLSKTTYTLKSVDDFDWSKVQRYYNKNPREKCRKHFGISLAVWKQAKELGYLDYSEKFPDIQEYLCENSSLRRGTIKKYVISIKGNVCVECGNDGTWNKKPLTLQLDHINGIRNDNRLENIRLVCPNCHSQTETYAGRNKSYK